MSETTYHVKDIVRLTREMFGKPSGSEGEVIGWYTKEDPEILVRLRDGGVLRVPVDAVELVRRAAVP